MSAVDLPVKPEARPYLDVFAETASEPEWLRRARRAGLDRFAERGFPSRRSENWRYLDLRPLEQHPMLPSVAAEPTVVPDGLALDGGALQLVLVDGRFAPELSRLDLPVGVWLGSTAQAMHARSGLARAALEGIDPDAAHPFAALNTAFFSDGFVLDIAPGVSLDRPIQIVHLASGAGNASLHTRSAITLGESSRANIVETYAGRGRYWRNDVLGVVLGDRAELAHIVLVEEAAGALHLGQIGIRIGDSASFNGSVLLLGGGTARHEANIRMGERARCRIDGAFVVADREEANIVTAIDHAAPGGITSELVKGVAAGSGHGAFQGKILVREGAQQTDARQTSRNLILGRRASIDTKPELEILADDVRCAHGASVGELDEAALFYLRARGIPADEARRLLIEGFLREPVEAVANPAIRAHLLRRLSLRLARLEDA